MGRCSTTGRVRVSPDRQDDYLERVKAEIRGEADAARARAPLPRRDPPPRAARPAVSDGIERERLDYAIAELTGPHYIAFVDHVFRAILKRPPDDTGATMQLRLLAAGAPKAEVIGNLRWSPEGRRVGTRVRGLLPRYALAKFARAPVLGYALQWGLAFAGLPLLLRHQRAADTSTAAGFNAIADAQRDNVRRFEETQAAHQALGAEHDRRSDELRGEIRRLQLRVDDLEQRAATLEDRARALERRSDALEDRAGTVAHELGELRHYVHAANHWVASLQRSLAELEEVDAAERERVDAFAAALRADDPSAAARRERYRSWSAALAERLPPAAQLFDLGSGDGAWLAALAGHGLDVSGVEANAHLLEHAHGVRIAQGEPVAALARCTDGALGALGVDAAALATAAQVARIEWLQHARRVLKPDGWLALRCERAPYRLADADADIDAERWAIWLAAAGFESPQILRSDHAAMVLAQRGSGEPARA